MAPPSRCGAAAATRRVNISAVVHAAAALIVVTLAAALLLRAPMFPPASPATSQVLAAFRIAFAVVLLFRLHRLRSARHVLWPASRGHRADRWFGVTRVITLWQAFAVLLAAGLVTPVAAAGCLLCGLYVFERSYTHSLEDVLFQANSFFLIILDSSALWSLDRLLDLHRRLVPLDLALHLWFLGLAILLFSAGLEKMFSPMWRQGRAFGLFIGLPHLVQPRFRFLRAVPRIGWYLSWTTVVAELGLLALAPWQPARLVLLVVLAGFAVCLFLVVDLSFIGQTLVLWVAALGAIDALGVATGRGAAGAAPLLDFAAPAFWLCMAGIAVVAGACFWFPVAGLRKRLAAITRFTVGLEPIQVFTDSQLYGIYLYRVIAMLSDGGERPLVQTFLVDGACGPLQTWQPRVFLKLTYEVTDLCLLIEQHGRERARKTLRFEATCDLVRSGFAELTPHHRAQVDRLVLHVSPVQLESLDDPRCCSFTLGPWQPLLTVRVAAGLLGEPELHDLQVRVEQSMRGHALAATAGR